MDVVDMSDDEEAREPTNAVDNFTQIDEEAIRGAALTANDSKSSWNKLLKIAHEWREAGCTPVFIVIPNTDGNVIGCVSRETFDKSKVN
jgi:hypothetical protein